MKLNHSTADKGLSCFASKMTNGGIGCPVALPQATIVIWFFQRTHISPFSALFVLLLSVDVDPMEFQTHPYYIFALGVFPGQIHPKHPWEDRSIFMINCLHLDLSSGVATAKRNRGISFQKSLPPPIGNSLPPLAFPSLWQHFQLYL